MSQETVPHIDLILEKHPRAQPRFGQHAAVSRSVQAAPPCGDIFHLEVSSEHEGQCALLDKQCGARTRSALSPSVRRWLR